MADRKNPRGFKIFKDRKGKWRCYHRKTREPMDLEKCPLYSVAYYTECYRINELVKSSEQAKPGTLGLFIKRYHASDKFKDLAPRTQADYQRCFDYLKSIAGTPLKRFTPPLVRKIRDKAATKLGIRWGIM
nr:hypothetical protein [Marinicella sp. W31]MDC2879558.1 hypothetical protein [Marinicella sp. W31]